LKIKVFVGSTYLETFDIFTFLMGGRGASKRTCDSDSVENRKLHTIAIRNANAAAAAKQTSAGTDELSKRNALAAATRTRFEDPDETDKWRDETRVRRKAAKDAAKKAATEAKKAATEAKKAATEAKKAPGEDNVVEGVDEAISLLGEMLASS
jgi:hypothetical protein